jgi:ribonuclease Z
MAIGRASPANAQADALRVTFCGTSGPLPVRDRAKPCTAIQAGGSLYLVDIGWEATENLLTWRLPLAKAKAVFITHLRSDHIGEVGEFNMQSWVAGRPQPLALVGPPGVADLAEGFNLA